MKLKALNLSHSLLSSLLFFSTKKHIRCLESILWRESRALPLNFIAMRSLLWQPDPLTAPRRLAEWMNEWMGWLYPRLFAVAGGINDETRPVMSADEAPTTWTRWNDKKKKNGSMEGEWGGAAARQWSPWTPATSTMSLPSTNIYPFYFLVIFYW